MIHIDGHVRTDDLALATVLFLHGYNPRMERGRRGVVWILSKDEVDDAEFVEDLVTDYIAGGCRVEPRRFARELGAVRSNMYMFLGIQAKPRGAPVHDSPSAADATGS